MSHSPPSVQTVTWNWRQARRTVIGATPDLRRTAITQAVVMGLVAGLLLFVLQHTTAGRVVAGLAFLVLMLGLFVPPAFYRLHRFGQALGRLVGSALVYVLLVPFFYLIVLPGALWLRLRRRDPLHRRFREPRYSYWVPRRPQAQAHNIARQFLKEDRDARAALRDVGSLPERDPGPDVGPNPGAPR